MFDIKEIRAQFPALDDATIFFDNPAGTQVPRTVIAAVADAMIRGASNIGGKFPHLHHADVIWERAHAAMAMFLAARSPREIILGQSMTMLTFHISRSLARMWQAGDDIVVTRMDHEGNVAPWVHAAQDRGVNVRWLRFNTESWQIEPDDLRAILTPRTKLLALNCASNLTGSVNPIRTLTSIAREAGALVYLDAVQYAPHVIVDVEALGCDFLCCSSYKLFGPHLGVLWGKEALLRELYPYAVRCAPVEPPGRHELGTPQTELFAGLAATVDYWCWLGGRSGDAPATRAQLAAAYERVDAYERHLTHRLIDELLQIPGMTLFGRKDSLGTAPRVPTVSVTHQRRRSSELAAGLAARRINVWSGHNYAFEVARFLGLDLEEGVLRIGLAHYNSAAEVERFVTALKALTK